MVLPHADKIPGPNDECFEGPRRVLKHAGQRRGHQRFAKSDDIAKDYPSTLFKVLGGYANRCGLEFKQDAPHIRRDGELGKVEEGRWVDVLEFDFFDVDEFYFEQEMGSADTPCI
jgi:hypothetical protein